MFTYNLYSFLEIFKKKYTILQTSKTNKEWLYIFYTNAKHFF